MKKIFLFLIFCILIVAMSGCAPANHLVLTQGFAGKIYGFWWGILHGMIAPVVVWISLFRDDVSIYAVYNSGFGYNIGYIIGIMLWGGGAKGGSHYNKKRKN